MRIVPKDQPRILLIGKHGQVGWELRRTLAAMGQVMAVDYPEIDLTDAAAARRIVLENKPTVVINAAAYTAVDKAESDPETARLLNGVAPGVLAEAAKQVGALMVHFSTDYVFDGTKTTPYVETDTPNPLGVYGRTKLEGDQAVVAVGGDHLSNDLAYGLKVPLSRAEQLKIEHGAAFVEEAIEGQVITQTNELGLPLKTVNLEHLRRIMSLRLEEIFQLVGQDVEQAGLLDYLRAGAFLCGGVARIPNIANLAEQVLQMPVCVGKTNSISGLKSALDQPEFAAAIGLVKFGSFKSRKREARPSWAQGLKGALARLLPRT